MLKIMLVNVAISLNYYFIQEYDAIWSCHFMFTDLMPLNFVMVFISSGNASGAGHVKSSITGTILHSLFKAATISYKQ